MIKQWALGMVLLAGGATLAGAQTSVAPAENAPAAKPAKADKPKKVCRKETEVGTIMPTRTCHTKEEWAAIDGRNGDEAANARDIRGGNGGRINPN